MSSSNPGGGGGGSIQPHLEQLKARYVGIGHADLSKYEFMMNQHRDTYSSIIGHFDQLTYMSVATNESIQRTKLQFIHNMIQPCGNKPTPQSQSSTINNN